MSDELVILSCIAVVHYPDLRYGRSTWDGASEEGGKLSLTITHDGVDSMDDKIGDELRVTFHD